jgi:hypothetical protein
MGDPNKVSPRTIGFRLANELEGLLEGISADAVINGQEAERLRRWTEENARYAWIEPFAELDKHLTRILADGIVTMEECTDLLWVVRKFTRANPYFDQFRSGLQVLIGMLSGVAADGLLKEVEVAALNQWTEEWSHLRGLWPYDEVCAIAGSMLAANRIAQDKPYLLDLANQLPIAGAEDTPPLVLKGVCAVDPLITFRGRTFVFTGESQLCERRELQLLVSERGARYSERVTRETDYLVVCDGGSQVWAFSCYGRKIEQAYAMRRDGHQVLIVHELDFWDAIAGTGAAV